MKQQAQRLLFASICALLATIAAGGVYAARDWLFDWKWAVPHGQFSSEPHPSLAEAARAFAEARNPGQACVEQWVGRDARYLYVALGCAMFKEHLGEIVVRGDQRLVATRLRYEGTNVLAMEQPSSATFANGLKRLFPREAAMLLKERISLLDFRRAGLARMREKGLPTLGD